MQYRKDMEIVALKRAECFLAEKINTCGLFVNKEIGYLAASPGDLIYLYIFKQFY